MTESGGVKRQSDLQEKAVRGKISFQNVKDCQFVLILFLFSVLVRGLLADFPKVIRTYPDELYYLKYACALWHREPLTAWGTESSFMKILYPLFLAPSYAVQDGALRVSIISWINAALVSSAVIPAYLLMKDLIKKRKWLWISLILFEMWPDLSYAETFFAENLFIPLSAWMVYLIFKELTDENTGLLHALFLGAAGYMTFLCKEAVLSILGAYAAVQGWLLLRDRDHRKDTALSLLFSLIGFGLTFGAFKLILPQKGSYYFNVNLKNITLDRESISFLIKGTACFILYWLISWGFLPAVYPAVRWKRLDRSTRTLYVFTIISVFFTIAGTVYSVLLLENSDRSEMRIHMRYLIPLWVPTLVCFINAINVKSPPDKKEKTAGYILSAVFLAGIWLILLPLSKEASIIDSPVLNLVRLIGADSAVCKTIITAAVLLFCFLIWKNRTGLLAGVCLSLVFALGLLNQYSSIKGFRTVYRILPQSPDASAVERLETVMNQEDPLWDEKTLMVYDGSRNYDTYGSRDPYLVGITEFNKYIRKHDYQIEPGKLAFSSALSVSPTPREEDYQYIILWYTDSTGLKDDLPDITPEDLSGVRIIRRDSEQPIRFLRSREIILDSPVIFYGSDSNAKRYIKEGFSAVEPTHCWTEGKKAVLRLIPLVDRPTDLDLFMEFQIVNLGRQRCVLYANDVLIMDQVLTTEGSDSTTVSVQTRIPADCYKDGEIELRFKLPDAARPGNGDERMLALAFRELHLEKAED